MTEIQGMILAQRETISHELCRNVKYLNGPERMHVPDDKVSWKVAFKDYDPVHYTDPVVLDNPLWADPNIEHNAEATLLFNQIDDQISRISHAGAYAVVDGLPLNVVGRTGLSGRGLLGKWGPNHAADPVVTRWKLDGNGEKVLHEVTNQPVLQFVSIRRNDTCDWALPGGMVEAGDSAGATLRKEFGEEALNTKQMDETKAAEVKELIDGLLEGGTAVYQGYVDDPRNTDNAWMETVAKNYHDEKGAFQEFDLEAGDDSGMVQWTDVDSALNLYANHYEYVKDTAALHGAHW